MIIFLSLNERRVELKILPKKTKKYTLNRIIETPPLPEGKSL
jgi:hypothetical protein